MKIAEITTGMVFGEQEIVEFKGRDNQRSKLFKVRCECGDIRIIRGSSLLGNNPVKACPSCSRKKHGYRTTKNTHYLYTLRRGIKNRCLNKNSPDYPKYGMRGISIYEEWAKDFIVFKKYIESHLGNREKGQTLERIDNEKGYFPGNIKWATMKEQSRNRRNSFKKFPLRRIAQNGEIKIYKSIYEALDDGFIPSYIDKCLKGTTQTHKGYQWRPELIAESGESK